jgi:hypothetical protein
MIACADPPRLAAVELGGLGVGRLCPGLDMHRVDPAGGLHHSASPARPDPACPGPREVCRPLGLSVQLPRTICGASKCCAQLKKLKPPYSLRAQDMRMKHCSNINYKTLMAAFVHA